jgi:diketogulonate reductase-like aldo/keto reductase
MLKLALGAVALGSGAFAMAAERMTHRLIPRTGESLPVVGLGTWQTFDVADAAARAPLRDVLREFARLGGTVVDSSPMYGRSESVVGELAAELGLQKQLFIATKVWTAGAEAGIQQMEESFRRLRVARIDLMQVHNLVDWRTHLRTLRAWKAQGRIRYIGVTHYTESAYGDLERVLKSEELDFVQLNYSIGERAAERRLLPLAVDRRIAVLANRPLAQGALFAKVRGKPLPAWTSEIGIESWARFFLKFTLGHPAVTCVIPATSRADHLRDNMAAGYGPLPDEAARERMARFIEAL